MDFDLRPILKLHRRSDQQTRALHRGSTMIVANSLSLVAKQLVSAAPPRHYLHPSASYLHPICILSGPIAMVRLVNVTVARSSFRQRRQLHEFLRNGMLTCTQPKVSKLPDIPWRVNEKKHEQHRHMQAVLACACWVQSGQKKCS